MEKRLPEMEYAQDWCSATMSFDATWSSAMCVPRAVVTG